MITKGRLDKIKRRLEENEDVIISVIGVKGAGMSWAALRFDETFLKSFYGEREKRPK